MKDRRKNRARGEGRDKNGRQFKRRRWVRMRSEIMTDGTQVQAQYPYSLHTLQSIITVTYIHVDTHMDLLRSKTRPNTVWSRSSVLQFQRWCLNWCWHSLIHSFVPSPMACMMSGWRWQSCRCLFTKAGMLSQITRAPSAPMYLKSQKNTTILGGFEQNPQRTDSNA